MTILAMVLAQLCNPWCWSMQEAKTEAAEMAMAKFRLTYAAAVEQVAPGTEVRVEEFSGHLTVESQEAVAYTVWDGPAKEYVCWVNWQGLLEQDEAMRLHIAYHEACHLRDGARLQQEEQLTAEERHRMEMKAEQCALPYWAGKGGE